MAARAVGAHATTIARWRQRDRQGELLARRRGPRRGQATLAAAAAAVSLVRDTHGLIGAAALSRSVPEISRRVAATIKQTTCRDLERARREAQQHVIVTQPGIVRGFDSMELCRPGRPRRHALVAADGSVPYRTSWALSESYDSSAVARLLEHDFDRHGPPLVLRMDRAAQHTAPAIRALLLQQHVLLLQGPPHYAPYYGQLERQNREHRAWLAAGAEQDDFDSMMAALNGQWRRRSLGWRTATEAWAARPTLAVDRGALAKQVMGRAERIERQLAREAGSHDLSWRLAVKQVLIEHGFLRIEVRGWC